MYEKIWFFVRYAGSDEKDESAGEIMLMCYDKEELEDKYGVRKITPGMILKRHDDPDEPTEKVLEILNDDDDHLVYRLDALKQFEGAFDPEDHKPISTFLDDLLSKVHQLYVKEGVN